MNNWVLYIWFLPRPPTAGTKCVQTSHKIGGSINQLFGKAMEAGWTSFPPHQQLNATIADGLRELHRCMNSWSLCMLAYSLDFHVIHKDVHILSYPHLLFTMSCVKWL